MLNGFKNHCATNFPCLLGWEMLLSKQHIKMANYTFCTKLFWHLKKGNFSSGVTVSHGLPAFFMKKGHTHFCRLVSGLHVKK